MTVTLHAPVDTRRALDLLGPRSVDAILCSPPFLALRDYDTGSPDEIGQERNPAAFLSTLLGLTDMWSEMLAPHGSIAIELGDTYSGSGGAGGDYNADGMRAGQAKFKGSACKSTGHTERIGGTGWPLAKSLCVLPTLYTASLSYGRNLLTGEPCTQWQVRNLIVWARPNPAVGGLGDKVRPAVSYITVACRPPRKVQRWFDLDAVRVPSVTPTGHPRGPKTGGTKDDHRDTLGVYVADPAGAPPLDYWTDEHDTPAHDLWEMTTHGSSIKHYAMWPGKLADRLVRLLVPERVCATCGAPSRRLTAKSPEYAAARAAVGDFKAGRDRGAGLNGSTQYVNGKHMDRADVRTIGWSDCGHDDWRPGIVLDPFSGAGTTLAAADLAGRDAIGIELNDNAHELYAIRRAEVARSLYGAPKLVPGQGSLLDGWPA